MPAGNDKKVDEDSLAELQQVRKGQPRRFVMITKGPAILALVVYKKGTVEKHTTAAKKLGGNGDVCFGIVEGRGPDINFQIPAADFKDPPVKNSVLKTFLEKEADYKAKPLFEIVQQLGPVLDPNDPLVQEFLQLQQRALDFCDAHPEQAEAVNALCLRIGTCFEQDLADEAKAKLAELKSALDGGSSGGTSTSSEPKTEESSSGDDFAALYAKLEPEVAAATKSGVDGAGAWKTLLDGAKQSRADGDAPAAVDVCRKLAAQLAQRWADGLRDASARVKKLLAGSFRDRAGDVEKIKTVLGFAQERAEAERFGGALAALKNLAQLLDAAEKSDAPKEADVIKQGTVAARKKFVTSRWQTSLRRVSAEIDKLRDAIALENPDEEDPDEIPDLIEKSIFDFCGTMDDAILGIQKAGEEEQQPIEAALRAIKSFREEIPRQDLILHLKDAQEDLSVQVEVDRVLLEALDEIEENLVG